MSTPTSCARHVTLTAQLDIRTATERKHVDCQNHHQQSPSTTRLTTSSRLPQPQLIDCQGQPSTAPATLKLPNTLPDCQDHHKA